MTLKMVLLQSEKRYVVAWNKAPNDREVVIVYDKFSGKVVYKVNTVDHLTAYPYIQEYYGKQNCVAPKQVDLRIYE